MKKVVLAYSGGLDTSCIIPWLKDKGYATIAFIADVGQRENFEELKQRAIKTGASKAYCLNLQQEFAQDYVFRAIKAGAVYEEKYFLATALSRPLIAKHQVAIAKREKAGAIAHGCTGKGNDQVRFEVTARLIDPGIEIIAPVRIWEFKTREQEIDYARMKKIPINVTKKSPYSVDLNLYGRSIECGVLEDPWHEPPEEIYHLTKSPLKAPARPAYHEVEFQAGLPVKLDGKALKPIDMIHALNKRGGDYGIGRVDMIENRLVGIKSREIYENPAAAIIHACRKDLLSLVLDRDTQHHLPALSQQYAELIYNGLWETPNRRQLDVYFNEVGKRVSGTVRCKLYKGQCVVVGRKSRFSRYQEKLATYGDKDQFNQRLSEGFVRLWGLPFQE